MTSLTDPRLLEGEGLSASASSGVGHEEEVGNGAPGVLWEGDRGTLTWEARQALVTLAKGPYLDGLRYKDQWKALLGAQEVIASRLADMFLDLVIDTERTLAFVRNVAVDKAPKVVRTRPLTFVDTVILLHLRQLLLQARLRGESVFVDRSDIADAVAIYRPHASTDEAGFSKAVTRSINKLKDVEILQDSEVADRFRISPILELIFGADEIAAVTAQYEAMLRGEDTQNLDDHDSEEE